MSAILLHIDFTGHGFNEFPLVLTQLAALECLKASGNHIAELPPAITALARLTELWLGRTLSSIYPLQRHSDARALGDLSGFPALCGLTFECCEVICASQWWAQGGTRPLRAFLSA